MLYTGEHTYPFDDTHRAYRRFVDIARDHVDLIGWTTTGSQPALTTVRDRDNRSVFTVAVIDSHQALIDPHTVLTVHRDATLCAHGLYDGPTAADAATAPLVAKHDTVAATKTTRLRAPDEIKLPTDAWQPIPAALTARLHGAPATGGDSLLILLDRRVNQLAALGPFPSPDTAAAWQTGDPTTPDVDRIPVPLHLDAQTASRSAS